MYHGLPACQELFQSWPQWSLAHKYGPFRLHTRTQTHKMLASKFAINPKSVLDLWRGPLFSPRSIREAVLCTACGVCAWPLNVSLENESYLYFNASPHEAGGIGVGSERRFFRFFFFFYSLKLCYKLSSEYKESVQKMFHSSKARNFQWVCYVALNHCSQSGTEVFGRDGKCINF